MSPIHNLARGVIIHKDYILLCWNPKFGTYLYLPGGHIEEGERAEDALIRELKEETTLDFKVSHLLGVFEHSYVPQKKESICHTHEYNFIFLATSTALSPPQLPPEPERDSVRFAWVAMKEIGKKKFYPEGIADILSTLLKNPQKNNYFFSKMR